MKTKFEETKSVAWLQRSVLQKQAESPVVIEWTSRPVLQIIFIQSNPFDHIHIKIVSKPVSLDVQCVQKKVLNRFCTAYWFSNYQHIESPPVLSVSSTDDFRYLSVEMCFVRQTSFSYLLLLVLTSRNHTSWPFILSFEVIAVVGELCTELPGSDCWCTINKFVLSPTLDRCSWLSAQLCRGPCTGPPVFLSPGKSKY